MHFYSKLLTEIPLIFHSVEFDGPFHRCLICTSELLNAEETPYVIEKVFRGPEAIVEMAVCLDCMMGMKDEISEESSLTIQNEFQNKVDWNSRLKLLPNDDDEQTPDVDLWIDQCLLDGTPRDQCNDYQICGLFVGDKIMLGQLPYIISSKAASRIGEKLSKKTRDQMGDFIETHFGMPPEFCSPAGPVPVLL